jgi:hypothetical protein
MSIAYVIMPIGEKEMICSRICGQSESPGAGTLGLSFFG